MLGANKNGKAYELKKKLDGYIKFINENSNTKFAPLALDGKEDPLFKNNPDQRNKDFAELNFGQTPLVASLAILSEYQSRVSTMEATTLTALAEKVGSGDIPIDGVRPMVSPVSRVVAAGTKYEAQLFMAATSSNVKPKMEFGSNPINVDENGVGKISFTASGGPYNNEGFSRKVWTGKVTMRMPGGKDSTFTVSEEYLVAKPVIEIKAAAVQALYKNCGNKLNIQVPALGNSYNPRFTADGANVFSGATRGLVTVVPTSSSVTLKVSSDGNYIGEDKFRVRLIPLPTIDIKVDGRKPDIIKGVPPSLRMIKLTPIPDKDFAEFLPDDAIYSITKVRVRKARSGRGMPPVEFNSGTINLGSLASDLQNNDKFIIEVLELKRRNFRGEWEEVKMPEVLTTFSITINNQ
jgi:gliding motility-associated protein GldM